jgi:hypothetical protein
LFPLFSQCQLALELFNAAAFRGLLRYLSGATDTDAARLASLILTEELSIETGIVGAPSTLSLLLKALFSCVFFSGAALLLFLPLTLFLIPTLLLQFHFLAFFLS